MFDERGTKGERRRVPPLAAKGEPVADRYEHEWPPAGSSFIDCIHGCEAELGQPQSEQECPVRLRAALDAATRERDDYKRQRDNARRAEADATSEADGLRDALDAATRERDEARAQVPLILAYLRSPKRGPGLILSMYADAIERGEHTKEEP